MQATQNTVGKKGLKKCDAKHSIGINNQIGHRTPIDMHTMCEALLTRSTALSNSIDEIVKQWEQVRIV